MRGIASIYRDLLLGYAVAALVMVAFGWGLARLADENQTLWIGISANFGCAIFMGNRLGRRSFVRPSPATCWTVAAIIPALEVVVSFVMVTVDRLYYVGIEPIWYAQVADDPSDMGNWIVFGVTIVVSFFAGGMILRRHAHEAADRHRPDDARHFD